MSRLDFLRAALPPGTRYSLRVIKKDGGNDVVRNKLFNTVEELDQATDAFLAQYWNVYYATAGFGALNNAKADNAVAKQEFYIDVDCGVGKPYADKAAGLLALKDFAKQAKLPRPTLIDSGNGLHAHWLLNEAIPIHDWKAVADALKERCQEFAFNVDASCTADVVRVLRVPDTINFKGGNDVRLLTPVVQYSFETIKSAVGVSQGDLFAQARALTKSAAPSEVVRFYDKNRVSKFETIWLKSSQGTGCAQIQYAIENADELPEPLWRAALSVAQYCEDRDWAIHEISKNHPDYDPEQTETKAARIQGPYTCESFASLGDASLCVSCPHAAKIKSPIQLGAEVKQAKPEDNELYVKQGAEEIRYEIPSYPWPFFRGAKGGIYVRVTVDTDEGKVQKDEMVYCHDLYVFDRQRDADAGDVVWVRHHMPSDGIREFMIPQVDIGARDRLRDAVSKEGVTVFTPKQLGNLQAFFAKQIEELQGKAKASNMHTRFGWTSYGTFVLGEREYTPEGVKHAPVASVVSNYAEWFRPKGTLDQWKRVAAAYKDEVYDFHAAGVLAGFGSVLMAFSPENGGIVNYYSKDSGTGKTTILKLANSIYGDPVGLMSDARDTKLSKVHRMGVLNGVVYCLDEITNMSSEELSDFAYGSTQGRARNRMQSGANAERSNRTSWKLIALLSSNSSVEDKLRANKMDPQGELARVLEITLKTPVPTNVLEAQKLFSSLNDNYGHAGDIFLNFVVPNKEDVQRLWNEMRDKIYAMYPWTQTERFKLNKVICIATAGVITNALGLTDYDIKRVTRKLCKLVRSFAKELQEGKTSAIGTFSAFINQNINNVLVINSVARLGNVQERASMEPRGPLRIRYEPDTDMLYIVQRDFDRWCAENYINTREIRSLFLAETGYALEIPKKRISKGWKIDAGGVSAYCIKKASATLGIDELNESSSTDTGDAGD